MPSAPKSSAAPASSSRRQSPSRSRRPATTTAGSQGDDGRGHLTLFVQNGRVHDVPGAAQQTALRTIAQMHDGDFRLTPNQNLIIANVPTEQAGRDRAHRARGGAARALVRLAAQFDGLRRVADLRARARRERALSARSDRRARREAGGARALGGRHRHPHDRLPEWLRAALSRRDRLGRQRTGPLQPLSRRGLRRLADEQALRRRSRSRRHRRRARSVVRRLRSPSGRRANASATSRSAPASSPRAAMGAIFTPTPGSRRRHERAT